MKGPVVKEHNLVYALFCLIFHAIYVIIYIEGREKTMRWQYDDNYVCDGIELEFQKYKHLNDYELEEIVSRHLK